MVCRCQEQMLTCIVPNADRPREQETQWKLWQEICAHSLHSSLFTRTFAPSESPIMTSSGFAALMALSQAQTQESTRAADSIHAERRRKEEDRRRQQEEEDRKERAQQAKLLRYQLEEQKREKERQLKREQECEAKLKEMERREEEQRQALLYGPKRAKDASSRHPGSSSASKRTSDNDSDADPGLALTREEKRERRLQLQFSKTPSRRAGSSAGTSRAGRRLPGGALNMTAPSSSQSNGGSANDSKSVRARLAAMPNTLTKLNTVKRDTRTIDEILRDRAKARENKTLEGEEAREFHDWFGTKTKSAPATKASSPSSAAASGASTPTAFPQRHDTVSSTTKKSLSPHPPVSTTPSLSSLRSTSKTAPKASSLGKHPRASLNIKTTSGSSKPPPNKHARSPPSQYDGSESESDRRPHKRTPGASNGIQDEIWKIFGRDRSKYVARNVMSDDEEMEADMTALEREELTRCVARFARSLLVELIRRLALGSPGRRTSRQNWKSVVTKKTNGAVARNEDTTIDCPSATSFVWSTIVLHVSLTSTSLPKLGGPYSHDFVYLLCCFTHVLFDTAYHETSCM